jgi:hypothetical protein
MVPTIGWYFIMYNEGKEQPTEWSVYFTLYIWMQWFVSKLCDAPWETLVLAGVRSR